MIQKRNFLNALKNIILKEKRAIIELNYLSTYLDNTRDSEEKAMILHQINALKEFLKKANKYAIRLLEKINLLKPLTRKPKIEEKTHFFASKPNSFVPHITKKISHKSNIIKRKILPEIKKPKYEKLKASKLEKQTLKRLRKKEKKEVKRRTGKPSKYVEISNKIFSKKAKPLSKTMFFHTLGRDLIKSGLQYTSISYISVILFTTLLSFIMGILIFIFFLFFNVGAGLTIITKVSESIGTRLLKVFG